MRVDTNFRIKASEISHYAKLLGRKHLGRAMGAALEQIGITSTNDFFVRNPGMLDQWEKPPVPNILTERTGRLITSVLHGYSFNATSVPQSVYGLLTKRKTGADDKKGKREGIRKVTISSTTIQGIIGTKTPYAWHHEYGGIIRSKGKPMVFANQNGEIVRTNSVKIPPRPFLEPAVKKAFPRVKMIMNEMVEATFDKANI